MTPKFQTLVPNLPLGKQECNSSRRKTPQKTRITAALVPGSLGLLKHHLAKFKCTCCFSHTYPGTHFPSGPLWTIDKHCGTSVPRGRATRNLLSRTETCRQDIVSFQVCFFHICRTLSVKIEGPAIALFFKGMALWL